MIWFQWVLVTTLGWLLGWAIAGGITAGIVAGLGQWLVLRQLTRRASSWIWVTIAGWSLGWLIVASGNIITADTWAIPMLFAGAILGLVVGFAQWLVLRHLVYNAGWWIAASTFGWTIGLMGVLGDTLIGAAVGAVTGFALDILIRHPRTRRA